MQASSIAPVLLTAWNRPKETAQVLQALRAVGPIRLFAAVDGPRGDIDSEAVREVRTLLTRAKSWCPALETNFADKNLGCRHGMERAISWFFDNVDEGIILEDDCVPSTDFLRFATECLERYRDDPKVMHVSGDCSMPVSIEQDWSYCFIRYPHSWGWATWRTAWQKYDSDMSFWDAVVAGGQVVDVFPHEEERGVWAPIFSRLSKENCPDSWAWRWAASCIVQGGLAVQPLTNLITNIGFDENATHTKRVTSRSCFPREVIYPLTHPPAVYRHLLAERQVFIASQQKLKKKVPLKLWHRLGAHIRGYLLQTAARVLRSDTK